MHTLHVRRTAGRKPDLTLGDAIAAVSAIAADDREVVAIVEHMLRRRSIRLLGTASIRWAETAPRKAERRSPVGED